jgi:hypothetical protein
MVALEAAAEAVLPPVQAALVVLAITRAAQAVLTDIMAVMGEQTLAEEAAAFLKPTAAQAATAAPVLSLSVTQTYTQI